MLKCRRAGKYVSRLFRQQLRNKRICLGLVCCLADGAALHMQLDASDGLHSSQSMRIGTFICLLSIACFQSITLRQPTASSPTPSFYYNLTHTLILRILIVCLINTNKVPIYLHLGLITRCCPGELPQGVHIISCSSPTLMPPFFHLPVYASCPNWIDTRSTDGSLIPCLVAQAPRPDQCLQSDNQTT